MARLKKVAILPFLLVTSVEICDGETCLCVPMDLNILDKFLISPLTSGERHQGGGWSSKYSGMRVILLPPPGRIVLSIWT